MSNASLNDLIIATMTAHGENCNYYGVILSKCKKYQSDEVPTMGIGFDKKGNLVLLWNPNYLKTITDSEAVAILKHESLHIFLRHLIRLRNKKDQYRANMAADIAINQYLKDLPKGALYPSTYKLPEGLSADEYYDLLEQHCNKNKQNKEIDDHKAWNKVVNEEGKIIGDADDLGVDTKEVLLRVAKDVAKTIKAKGNTPKWAVKEIESLINYKPVHNWKHEFRVLVNSIISPVKARSQKRNDRRLACVCKDFIFPGLRKDRMPKVLVVRDTSGSVFDTEIQKEFLSEIAGISKKSGVVVCDCDTEIKSIYTIKTSKDFKKITKSVNGGGGTSFVKPFELALKLNVDAVIYMTDLFGTFPEVKDIGKFVKHTLWVTFEKTANNKIPFGKLINITKNI